MDSSAPPLPVYSVKQLGPERTALAESLRQRLWQRDAALRWPAWIDARPGRLGAIVGDCTDPPLGLTRSHLARQHSALLSEGISALGLALCAPRLVLSTQDPTIALALKKELHATSIEICCTPQVFPAQPADALPQLDGVPWVVPAETLAAAGAALRGSTAPRLLSVVGALRAPGVFPAQGIKTPRELVQLAGGARVAAWMALRNDPLVGELWPADEPLPDDTSLLYILPAAHPLLRRHRAAARRRAQVACLSCRLCTDFCPQATSGTAPHRLMQAIARRELGERDAAAAGGCTSCGACSVICPAELLPSALTAALAKTQPPRGAAYEPKAPADRTKLPLELTLRRLDLLRYAATT